MNKYHQGFLSAGKNDLYSMNSVRVFDLLKSLTQKYNMDANEFWISKISSLRDTLYYILQTQPKRDSLKHSIK